MSDGKFQKGQSGNPKGRPTNRLADGRTLAEVAREYTETAIETLVRVCKSVTAPESAQVAAAQALLDRAWGKPKQPVVGGDDDDPPIQHAVDVSGLDDETLRKVASLTT